MTTKFFHSGTMGDVIAAVPAITEYYRKTGKRATLYLESGHVASYYEGATHPTRNEKGEMVMLNETMIVMLKPLLEAQEAIAEVLIWDKEPIQIDLNLIRTAFVNMPYGCISRWYFYVFPDLACDLSQMWLETPYTQKNFACKKIVVTRSERYLNPDIRYDFLSPIEKEILFVGTDKEYELFCSQFNLNVERWKINNFLELAQGMQQCRFHISNQTMAAQISAGLKIPRIVELCSAAPNVIPIGENAYDFYGQQALEWYVSELYTKTAN